MTRARRGVHALVVTAADGVLVRLAAERALRALGWVPAWSPADADLLVVCGAPEESELEAVERLWHQLPGPRARVRLDDIRDVSEVLVSAAAALEDRNVQEQLARDADMDHGQMDHGGMSMDGPGGIPLAEGATDDRDGLEMDTWHVVLGPGLPGWPAGLVLRAGLHGDVVTDLEVLAEPGAHEHRETRVEAALLLDAAAGVLELAGWSVAAAAARLARDDLVDGRDSARVAPRVDRLARRVRRSVLLRWSLEGPRRRDPSDAPSPGHLVRSRVVGLLASAGSMLAGPAGAGPAPHPYDPYDLGDLGELAVGQELATLRLLVAGLALDARVTADA